MSKHTELLRQRSTSAPPRPSHSRERGFTLIEVMVALIVLVLGVLGAAAMTLAAIKDNKQSGLRSQAVALAYEMSDLMRANPPVWSIATATVPSVLLFDTEAVFTGAAPTAPIAGCYTTGCNYATGDMAKNDFYEWNLKLSAAVTGLPNATAVICRDATRADMTCDGAATSPLVVKMKWDEKLNNGTFVADVTANASKPNLIVPIQPY